MNLYQGFNMNPFNFTDPMGEHTFKNINLFGQEIEVAQPDLDEIHRGYYAMRFSYEYKGKIQNVIVDQHIGEEWAFQAKLGNPILKPLWEALYGVSTSEIKESAFKLWSKSLVHHSPEIVMSTLGSIAYMAEANAARNIINTNKIIKINKAGKFYDAKTGRFVKTKDVIGTEADKAFFWSGRTKGVGGEKVSANIAEKYKGTTLEKLVEQRGIKMPEWNPNDPNSIRAWETLSREYAKNASGTVRAVIGESTRPGSVWENIELPELMKNPKVTKIIIIDPATGKETVIFVR